MVNRLATNFAITAFPKPAPGSLISSENLTELGTQMAVGTRLQTNKLASWFRIRQWKLSKELVFDGRKQHCKSETAFSWVSSYSTLVVVLQDSRQQPRESLISCLKVMFLLNQVLFSPKIVILMSRGTKEEYFVTI